jgi:hypothetical protein
LSLLTNQYDPNFDVGRAIVAFSGTRLAVSAVSQECGGWHIGFIDGLLNETVYNTVNALCAFCDLLA